MSNSWTQRWNLILSLALSLSFGCQKAKLSRAPEPENKSQNSLAACEQLNLARDAAWTASFLHQFVLCASVQNEEQQESFQHSLRLIEALGLERLQKAMDLLLVQPASFRDQSSVYPNLSALITLMDRGQHDERGQALPGMEARWDTLQTSLSAFRPRPFLQFLMALEEAQALDGFLTELMAFSDGLPPGAVAGLVHRILNEPVTRDAARTLQTQTLDDPLFAERLEKLWKPQPYPWKGQEPGSDEPQTFWGHARLFWDQATLEQQQRWAHAAAAFLRMGLETQLEELLRRTRDLYELFRSYSLRQPAFLSDLRSLLQEALDTELKDLEPAMKGLNQIKENPSYRDAFEEKAGSTWLHALLEDFLWEGGRLQSCSEAFAGMKSQPDLTDPRAILQPLLTPQASCQGRIPLLLFLDEILHLNCRTGICARAWMDDPVEIDAADLKRLSLFAWNWLEKELRADPYRLKHQQLAYGPIEGEKLEQLKAFWLDHSPASLAELVALDQKLAQDPRFEALLKKDFLESWYGLVLQKLNSLADEFRDIWPDQANPEGWYQKNSDVKLQRVGLGLYAFGPLDQAFAQALPLAEAFPQLEAKLPGVIDAANFSQIISPLRELAGQVKNAPVSIKPETEKITIEWPGSISTHLAYLPNGTVAQKVEPYSVTRLTRDAADSWLLQSRYRDQLPLLTAAADPTRAKALESWIQDHYLAAWSEALSRQLKESTSELPFELFHRTALAPEELRLLTLFAAQNFLGVTAQLPKGSKIASLPATPTFTRDRAPQAFLGVPVLAGSAQTWAGFWAFNSGYFARAKSLQDLLGELPNDEAAVRQGFLQSAENPQTLTQGRLNVIDRDRLSAQQKLLVQLQSVSSLYKARGQHQLVPSVGFAAFCAQGPTQGQSQVIGECPFTLENFAEWRRFLEERVLDHFCPFLNGPHFSAAFHKQWQDALGFQDNAAHIAQLCAARPALEVGSIPAAVWEHNFTALLRMGRNPQLKAGVRQLPEALRRLKSQAVAGDYQKFVRFHALTPLWVPVASARLQHREAVYAGFRWQAPGLIDHVIAAYNHEVGDRTFTDALKKLGRHSQEDGNPVYDLIHAVTETYAESQKAEDNTLAFVLRLADRISRNPQLIQTTSRLLEKPEDPFAGILLAYTFPQAMKVGVFEDFAWDHPSYRLMRLAFQPENRRILLGLVAAFDRLSPRLWKIYEDAASAYPDRRTMASDMEKLLRFAVDILQSADADGRLSMLWRDLMRKSLSDEAMTAFIRLSHQLREPALDLNNQWQPPLKDHLDQLLHTAIDGSLQLVSWLERLPASESFDLMRRALHGMSQGILEQDGSELWKLLQDKRLGLGDQGIMMEQLRDPTLRAELLFVLKALWSLESAWVLSALDEWERLAVSTQKVLHYFEKHVQWRGTGALSYQYFIKTLDHQMEDGQKRLGDQLNMLRHWLRPEEDVPVCGKETIAC